MYPLNQIPAERKRLPGFAWYDYIRPLNRYDIFNWRGKNDKKGNANKGNDEIKDDEIENSEKDNDEKEKVKIEDSAMPPATEETQEPVPEEPQESAPATE